MTPPLITLPTLPAIHVSFVLSTPALFAILSLFFLVYLVVSGVLFYHWTSYGMGSHGIYVGEILFVSVSIILFFVAFVSANYY